MKIKSGYILKKVMGSYMIVSLSGGVSSMQTMNETGAFLWDLMQNDISVEEMAEKMTAEYEVDKARAILDIENFISRLHAASLLDE